MRGPNSAFAVAAVLLASCNSTASSQQYRAHGEPSPGAAFSTPDEAVNAAVEMVCRPYLTGEATPARGKALAEAAGFRPASRLEALLARMLEADEDLSARNVVKASAGLFRHASDLTRNVERRDLLTTYQAQQERVRRLGAKINVVVPGR